VGRQVALATALHPVGSAHGSAMRLRVALVRESVATHSQPTYLFTDWHPRRDDRRSELQPQPQRTQRRLDNDRAHHGLPTTTRPTNRRAIASVTQRVRERSAGAQPTDATNRRSAGRHTPRPRHLATRSGRPPGSRPGNRTRGPHRTHRPIAGRPQTRSAGHPRHPATALTGRSATNR
jgi:hypothetical protein